jgi:hypothetical protein
MLFLAGIVSNSFLDQRLKCQVLSPILEGLDLGGVLKPDGVVIETVILGSSVKGRRDSSSAIARQPAMIV